MTSAVVAHALLEQILVSNDNQGALLSLRKLSSVPLLKKVYNDQETPENDKRLALLLLLIIARRSRVSEQVDKAYNALRELGIVSEDDLNYTSHIKCKCTGHVQCMRIAYNKKIKELYDQADTTKFWENQMFMWLLWLVENYENERRPENIKDGSSAVMDEAFQKFRCSLFMLDFMRFYDGRQSIGYLSKFLKDFISISVCTYNDMNPQYAGEQCNEEEDYDTGCRDCDGCDNCNTPEKMFLKEHQVRFMHIQAVLQQKLLTVTEHEKKIVEKMLNDVNDLNTRLHSK